MQPASTLSRMGDARGPSRLTRFFAERMVNQRSLMVRSSGSSAFCERGQDGMEHMSDRGGR
jgi:hypothetical protein